MGPAFTSADTDTTSGTEQELEPGVAPDAPVRKRRRVDQRAKLRKKKLKRWAKIAIAAILAIALILLLILWLILGRIDRIDAIEGNRPAGAKGTTFLVLGLDRRSDVQTTGRNAKADSFEPGEQRADIIMLMHVSNDRKTSYAVSIPRDTWVDVPGHGKAKINAAYSYGGPKLMVQTVRQLTGVWVDHLAVVDFAGFRQFTDAVGGVDVYFSEAVPIPGAGTWPQGVVHLDGELALSYVRQRYGLPNGDFDRIHRQQNFLRQLAAKTFSGGTLKSPARVKALLDQVAANVSVDDSFGNLAMMKFGWSMRSFDPGSLVFYTVPTQGTGWAGDQSIVVYDPKPAKVLWQAFADEDVTTLNQRFSNLALTGAVD